MEITEFGGYINIKNCPYDFWWCPEGKFPLNITTRKLFKNDILPLIKSGKCTISDSLYEKIKNFKQNIIHSSSHKALIQPQGITLKEHQSKALEYMMQYDRYGFFLGTGTGKTLIAITWLLNVLPETCLIVTPQKVVGQYREELDKYIPGNKYVVTNFEQLKHFTGEEYEALIVDESHRAKSFTSEINLNLRMISPRCKYVYLFTGTPQDKNRHEILAQLSILDNRILPTKTRIINRYFELDDYYNPKKEKKEFSEELTEVINSYTWGMQTEDAIELTDEHNYLKSCLPPTDRFYGELFKNRITSYNNMDCVADTPTKLRMYLRECCSGFLNFTDENNNVIPVQIGCPKDDALTELLQIKSLKRGIIYYEFTESLKHILAVLSNNNRTYVVVNGLSNQKKSEALINQFKAGDVDYLVIQSRSGNAGLDLTNVNSVIFYSLPESYIVFHQCKSRIRRIGQSKECNYYYLVSKGTIEEYILNSLRKKKSFTDKIFKQYI